MDADVKKYINIGLITAGAGLAFLVGRRIYNGIRGRVDAAQLNNLSTKVSSLATINATTARSIADGLFDAYNYWGGTDLDTVDTCLSQVKNEYDWLLVRKSFGIRPYGTTGTPWFGSGTALDLIGWCRAELSGARLKTCENYNAKANNLGLGEA